MSGIMPLIGHLLQRLDEGGIEVAGHALVDAGGIEEAVAQHDRAALDRRPDHLLDMVGARRGEQHRLHLRAERLGGARQQHMAHGFGARRAARFARHQDVMAGRPQLVGQPGDLRRLAGPFATLEGDEEAGRRPASSVNAPCMSGI